MAEVGQDAGALSVGAIHRTARYRKYSALVHAYIAGNPQGAVCWLHGAHVSQCPPHRDGRPSTWVAGHTRDGSTNYQPWVHVTRQPPEGDWLAPQCSASNASTGAAHGNRARSTGYTWP